MKKHLDLARLADGFLCVILGSRYWVHSAGQKSLFFERRHSLCEKKMRLSRSVSRILRGRCTASCPASAPPPRSAPRFFSSTLSPRRLAPSAASAAPATADSPGRFVHATAFLPHPDKDENGEDAFFAAPDDRVVGVADGVGGWVELGIDAGAFSRELMGHAKAFARDKECLDPSDILHEAYFKTTALGTCTACIVSLDGTELRAINVGDSGFSVLRRTEGGGSNGDHPAWALFFQTTEQTHFFNCPFQLGTNSKDSPADGQSFTIPAIHGDLVILATDGLLDNLFTGELIQLLEKFEKTWMETHNLTPSREVLDDLWLQQEFVDTFTRILGNKTQLLAKDEFRRSPFSVSAAAAGYAHIGGKLDDITAVVAVVNNPEATYAVIGEHDN